ncbi:uncharacterized protein LOC125046886 [Penaeus chinensis]|uniref:uncharacterized protein LOC125046886 n=1 Tax=Penaeus chinensis TaxID=139456 RepID=UPI001FB67AA2|nr:uncharacterized protein LOC125046886 [Penaeus chinensis]
MNDLLIERYAEVFRCPASEQLPGPRGSVGSVGRGPSCRGCIGPTGLSGDKSAVDPCQFGLSLKGGARTRCLAAQLDAETRAAFPGRPSGGAKSLRLAVSLLALLLSGRSRGDDVGWFHAPGPDKRFVESGIVLMSVPFSRIRCAAYCRLKPTCVSFNYNAGGASVCELLTSAAVRDSELSADSGWTYYQQRYPKWQRIQDPCASSPCPADSVCVSYEQPIYQKFKYDLDFYMCSRHAWLLGERDAGRTNCKHIMDYGKDYYIQNMPGWTAVQKPFEVAFQNCLNVGCRGLLCVNIEFGTDVCYMKDWSNEPGVLLPMQFTFNPSDPWVFWYPECI